ncbi:MAG: alpha/beta hydrolase [Gemmatimonadales bacterium]|nr:alpha/beta hydrolase [Gemmatimonadales bacterium]
MADTWDVDGYDLLPKLQKLSIPTLVIFGDHDFIPGAIAGHIAGAIPTAHLVTLNNCGHFAYLECAGGVRNAGFPSGRQQGAGFGRSSSCFG